MGGRGANSASGGISAGLQRHFEKENKKISELMSGKVGNGKSVEMDNGQILERYSMDEMKNLVLKEYKKNGYMDDDDSVAILYKDGNIAVYGGGDDTSKMKLSNIKGVIYENANTSSYSGTGIVIENYNEILAGEKGTRYGKGKDEDDWRINFE